MDPNPPISLCEKAVAFALLVLAVVGNAWMLCWQEPSAPLSDPVVAAPGCPAVTVGAMSNRACLGAEPKVVIWGDSMAHAWIPLAQALGRKLHEPATNLARDGCPPLIGAELTLRSPRESDKCAAWNADAVVYLRVHHADTLVIVARWRNFIRPELHNGAAEAIARSVAQASPYVRRILVIAPTPEFARHDPSVPRSEFEKDSNSARTALQALRGNPKVRIIEPADWLCDGALCSAERNGMTLYHDSFHVSFEAAAGYGEIVALNWN